MKNHDSFAVKNNYTITLISLHSLPYIGFYMAIFISHSNVSPMSLYISLRAVRLHSETESN